MYPQILAAAGVARSLKLENYLLGRRPRYVWLAAQVDQVDLVYGLAEEVGAEALEFLY